MSSSLRGAATCLQLSAAGRHRPAGGQRADHSVRRGDAPGLAGLARSHPRAPATGTSRHTRPHRPAATSRPAMSQAASGHPDTAGAGPASSPGPAGIGPLAPAAGRPRRSTRRRRPGRRHHDASRPGHARLDHAQRAPGARPRSADADSRAVLATSAPRASSGPSASYTRPAAPPRTRNTGWIASTRPARRRRQRTLPAYRSGIRSCVAIRPGHPPR